MVVSLQLNSDPDLRAEIQLAFVRATWPSSAGWNIAIDGSALAGSGYQMNYRPIGSSAR